MLLDAQLKKASPQDRTVRKWKQFNNYMRKTKAGQRPSLLCEARTEVGHWPVENFPVTTSLVKAFIWWLAIPLVETTSPWHREAGPRGHSFTYVRVLILTFLSYVEDMEWRAEEKGMYVFVGGVAALRQESFLVMRKIAV